MPTFPASLMRAAMSAIDMSHASAVTISHRMPMLIEMSVWPQYDTWLEAHRMVTEKLAAMLEGAFAASQETALFATRTAFGRTDPSDMATGMLSIAVAASQPAHRCAQANAHRLSRH